jgi:hypothetical protein
MYRLTDEDVKNINIAAVRLPPGSNAHTVEEDQQLPLLIVECDLNDTHGVCGTVFLPMPGMLYKMSISQGTDKGQWDWIRS